MANRRVLVKRRKAVRNIRKITKTMQMIATAKFQKSLKRAVGTKAFTLKVRELVRELAANVGDIEHPLLRKVTPENAYVIFADALSTHRKRLDVKSAITVIRRFIIGLHNRAIRTRNVVHRPSRHKWCPHVCHPAIRE